MEVTRGGVKELALALFLSCNKELQENRADLTECRNQNLLQIKGNSSRKQDGRYEIGWFVGIGDRNYSAQWFCGGRRRQLVGCLGRQVWRPMNFRKSQIRYFACKDK